MHEDSPALLGLPDLGAGPFLQSQDMNLTSIVHDISLSGNCDNGGIFIFASSRGHFQYAGRCALSYLPWKPKSPPTHLHRRLSMWTQPISAPSLYCITFVYHASIFRNRSNPV